MSDTENTEMFGYLHWIYGLNYASMYQNFIFDDIMKTDILASLTERKIKTNSIYGKMGNSPYIVRSDSDGISIINPSFLDCLLCEIDLGRKLFYDLGNYLTNLVIRPFGSSISIIYLLNHAWSLDHSSKLPSIENGFKLKHINTNELYFQFGFMFLERELARLNYSFSNIDRNNLTMFAYYNNYQVQSWKISKNDILTNHDLTNYYPSVIEYLLRCEFSNRWMDQLQLHKEQPIIEYLISHDRICIYPEESATALNNFYLNRSASKYLK